MLRITKNKSAPGLVRYMNESLSKDDYYVHAHSPGYWHGKLKSVLNLPNVITNKDFSALAYNRHPKTGEQLSARQRNGRVVSTEYMWSAPKSISIVALLSDKQTRKVVLNIHRRSVKKAMQAIEQDTYTQAYVNKNKLNVKTGNLLYGRFDHFTSRPLKDKYGQSYADMNLHSHCVVPNLTLHKGQMQAARGSIVHNQAYYYEQIYHSELAAGLRAAGIAVRQTKDRYEIDHPLITRELIERFSRRTVEINALAQELGIDNDKEKAKLGARTRKSKGKDQVDENLIRIWKSKLSAQELDAIVNIRQTEKSTVKSRIDVKHLLQKSLDHFLERQSTVPTKKLIAHVLKQGYGEIKLEDVQQALTERTDLLYAQKRYVQYVTTKSMVHAEDRMIDFASRLKNSEAPLHANYRCKQEFLSEQQRKAIQHILSSTNKVSILIGGAGTGKTTLLKEIKQGATEKSQKTVFAFAPSTVAREELRKEGFEHAETIAALKINQKLQAKLKNQIMLIDEAGLLGTRSMNHIMDIAQKQNARIILSGDTRQHSSPGEAGDAMRILIEKSGLPVAQVDDIQRQRNKPAYKKAVELIAAGRVRDGFDKLEQMNAIREIDDAEKRTNEIAKHHVQSLEQGKSVLTICPTHKEGMKVNDQIRSELKTRGRIQGQETSVRILKALNLTDSQKSDMRHYEVGGVIQFHQNVKGFKAGQQYIVEHIDQKNGIKVSSITGQEQKILPLEFCKNYQVFHSGTMELAKGDHVKITRNGRTRDKTAVYNGQVYQVEQIKKDGTIELSGGKTLDAQFGHLTHAYVITSHGSQGKTCDEVIIAQSGLSYGASNDKQFYVSASRARHRITIYTDDQLELKNAISRSGHRMSAQEIADRIRQKRDRERQSYYQLINQKAITHARIKRQSKNNVQRTFQL